MQPTLHFQIVNTIKMVFQKFKKKADEKLKAESFIVHKQKYLFKN